MLVGKKWKVESDGANVVLSKRVIRYTKETKEPYEAWAIEGYFSTTANALKALVNLEIIETELTDLKTVVDKIDEIGRIIQGLNVEVGK